VQSSSQIATTNKPPPTKQDPPFSMPDALPVSQPTALKEKMFLFCLVPD